jgi:hypothetical protein
LNDGRVKHKQTATRRRMEIMVTLHVTVEEGADGFLRAVEEMLEECADDWIYRVEIDEVFKYLKSKKGGLVMSEEE